MSGITDWLLSVPAPAAYALIATLVFAEAAVFVGFVLPGETSVVIGGVLASSGRLSLPVVVVVVVVAAIVGDTVGFEVGRHFGPRVLASRPLRRHRKAIGGAQRVLREKGGWAVFLGRFTAFLRAVMPGLAGTSGMPYGRFLAFNAAGGLVWGGGVAILGYVAGTSYAAVETALGQGGAVIIAVLIVAALVVWRRRRESAPELAGELAGESLPEGPLPAAGLPGLAADDSLVSVPIATSPKP